MQRRTVSAVFLGLFFILIGFLVGCLSHSGLSSWYLQLIKPWFNPPSWLFGPVWTFLYFSLGLVAERIYYDSGVSCRIKIVFGFHMLANYAWSFLFFYYHFVGLALLDLGFMIGSAVFLLYYLYKEKSFLFLFLPYFCWITFAGILNSYIYWCN